MINCQFRKICILSCFLISTMYGATPPAPQTTQTLLTNLATAATNSGSTAGFDNHVASAATRLSNVTSVATKADYGLIFGIENETESAFGIYQNTSPGTPGN